MAQENPPMRFFNSQQTDSAMPLMLEPDHKIMERFQTALKEHLMRQKEKLSSELLELRKDLKKTKKEEEEIGVQLYDLKRDVAMQQKTIQERQKKLEEYNLEKESLSQEMKKIKYQVREQRQICDEEKQKEHEMRIEVEKLHRLERKVIEWKSEVEGDLTVNLRVSEKTEVDRKQLMENNRKLDMLIFKLMSEVGKLESELSLLNTQLERKEKEKELISETLADANADLEVLVSDQKRLLVDWNAVMVAMVQRDNAYSEVVRELNASEEAFHTLSTEIESYKKSVTDEIKKSEELGLVMSRINRELESNSRLANMLVQRKVELERNVAETTELALQTERDLKLAEAEKASKDAEFESVNNDFSSLSRRKQMLEDDSLNLLLEKSTNDKAAMHLNRSVKAIREQVREQEIGLVELENRIAKLIIQTEDVKAEISRNQDITKEMNKDLSAREAELAHVAQDTREVQNQITSRQGKLLILTRKMEELKANAGWDEVGSSPLELRIRDMEWKVQELKKENDTLQAQWMRQQDNNVKLTGQRSDMHREISLLRQQVIILEKKRVKTNEDLQREHGLQVEMQRNITNLHHKLTNLSSSLATKSGSRYTADRDLLLQQFAFIQSLKDSEREQVNLKSEIKDLERTLEERAETMLDTQREMLVWEKKVKIATETKLAIQKEKSDQGDIGQMKQEIHRMEVRFSQLKKVQDKLITDLEQTVRRRETILDEAEAREKRERGANRSRANFQRRVDDVRNRLKMTKQEQKLVDKLMTEAETNHGALLNKLNEKTEQVKILQKEVDQLDLQLEDAQLRYQQTIEILVRRQRKCKLYGKLKAGKYRLLYRNELALENELGIVRTVNDHLVAILEALIADFPTQHVAFVRILNTVKPDDV